MTTGKGWLINIQLGSGKNTDWVPDGEAYVDTIMMIQLRPTLGTLCHAATQEENCREEVEGLGSSHNSVRRAVGGRFMSVSG